MNYDVWGSWSPTAGPNAPLYDSCAPAQDGSAQSGVTAWTAAKFPANQVNDSSAEVMIHSLYASAFRLFSAYPRTDTVSPLLQARRSSTMLLRFTHNLTNLISLPVRVRPTPPLTVCSFFFLEITIIHAAQLATDVCGNPSGNSGIWQFNGLITAGFLQNNNGTVTAASGMYYTFDNCSQTVCYAIT